MRKIYLLLFWGYTVFAFGQTITTVSGCGQGGSLGYGDGGPATSAKYNYPYDVTATRNDTFYVADGGTVRIINAAGIINTIPSVNTLYVESDSLGNIYFGSGSIYKRSVTGTVTHIAGGGSSLGDGGPATSAQLTNVSDVAFDTLGNIFICDNWAHRIRKINTSGIITTYAGNGSPGYTGDGGPATSATLYYPEAITCDKAGNLYIADAYNHVIRKVSVTGTITTYAGSGFGSGTSTGGFNGDGPALSTDLNYPASLVMDPTGQLVIADTYNNRIRVVNNVGNIVTIIGGVNYFPGLGDGGPASAAYISIPNGIDYDKQGNLYIMDYNNVRTRKVSVAINTGITEKHSTNAMVYPNPSSGYILINATDKTNKVKITDINGKIVFESLLNTDSFQIDLKEFPGGIYILNVNGSCQKIIKL